MNLIVFDCDGVLVDTEPSANRIFAQAIRELGIPWSEPECLHRFTGLSMARCIEMLESELDHALPPAWLANLQAETFATFRHEGVQAVRGIESVLDQLDEWGWPYCVASSGEHEKMKLTLGLTGLISRFGDRRFSAQDVSRGKPYPDLFLHAAGRMGADPMDCAVVEDSVPGVQAAVAAGMAAFGYAERTEPDRLHEKGVQVFRAMEQLGPLLQRWAADSRAARGGMDEDDRNRRV